MTVWYNIACCSTCWAYSILGWWLSRRREAETEGKAAGAYHLYTATTRELFIFMEALLPSLSLSRAMVFPELEERTRRGTNSDGRREGRVTGGVIRLSLVSCSCPEIPSAPGRETPCPLNGVTGLPWLRGTPWNRRHRRAQRKAHLFWKNIIRTRTRHEPHQGRCSPVLASLSVQHRLILCTRWECNWSACAFFSKRRRRRRAAGR